MSNDWALPLRGVGDKIREQIRQNHPKLLSEIDLDDEDLAVLRSNASILAAYGLSGGETFDIQLAYYMMDVGMRNYHDGTYWTDFWNEVSPEDHTPSEQNDLGEYFLEVIRRYNLAVYRGKDRRFVNNIMMHAFIPDNQQYRDAFFDFILKFYRVVLDASVPDDLDGPMKLIADVFRSGSFQDYPEFRNLLLIQSTKIALSDVNYFGPTVKKIILRLSGTYESAEEVNLGRYENSFREWASSIGNPKSRRHGINEKPYLRFDLSTNYLYLVVPPTEVSSTDRGDLTISQGGRVIHSERTFVSVQFGKAITEEMLIPVGWNPLERFEVKVGGVVRYDDENHGFILLNKKGNMRKRVSQGFNMIIHPPELRINLESNEIAHYDRFMISGFMITAGQALEVNGRRFAIEDELSANIHIISPSVDVGCKDQDGNKYNLYPSHPTIRISVPESKGRFRFSVGRGLDSISYDLLDDVMADPASVREGDDIILRLRDTRLGKRAGIYRVRYNGREIARYVMIHGFSVRFERELYTENGTSTVSYTGSDSPVQFDTSQGTVDTEPIQLDGHEFTITMQVPSRRFSFDRRTWHMFGEVLYFRDTQYSELYIYCPTLVYPIITVDYPGSRPIGLEVDGQLLRCPFKKISMISSQIEHSNDNTSALSFKCGGYRMFAIRYNADYDVSGGGWIYRRNAPEGTWAICELESGETRELDQYVNIDDWDEDFSIVEYYDSGFGTHRRVVRKFQRSVQIRPDVARRIMAGDDFEKIVDQYLNVSIPGSEFRNLIRLDKPYIWEIETSSHERYGSEPRKSKAFDRCTQAVKKTMLRDSNLNRLKARAYRFKDVDPEFALEFCDAFQKLSDDNSVRELRSEIEDCIENEYEEIDVSDMLRTRGSRMSLVPVGPLR